MSLEVETVTGRETVKKEYFKTRRRLFQDRSANWRKYQDCIIGNRSLLRLLKYELIMLTSSWVPGALGLLLRSKLYPLLLKRAGKGIVFGKDVVLRHPHKICIGDNTIIDDNCLLDGKGVENQGIIIGKDVFIGRNSIILCTDGDIHIDDNVSIGFNCEVMSANYVHLGKKVLLSSYCYLNAATHDFSRTDIPVVDQESTGDRIILEQNAWLAANVTVLDGVTIGRDAIVGAGAVVTRNIPPLTIAVGVPAKAIRSRCREDEGPLHEKIS